MTAIDVRVEPAQVDAAAEAYALGARMQVCCPIARALQAQVERVAVVFQASWHLGAQDRIPATRGEPLPPAAVAWIAKFDDWAKRVRANVLAGRDLGEALADPAIGGRPGGIRFSVELPSRPIKEEASA